MGPWVLMFPPTLLFIDPFIKGKVNDPYYWRESIGVMVIIIIKP
jgi:hypothetical protein